MTIVNEFSVALPLDTNEVISVLSDIQLHLSLWPVIESLIEVLSNNEVLANVRIGNSVSRVRFKIGSGKEDEASIVTIEGRNDFSLELRLSIVSRRLLGSPLTLVRGRVIVKSANEKVLKPYIKEFVEAYQNRLIDLLPAVIEAWKKGLTKKAEKKMEIVTPSEKVVLEKQAKREELQGVSLEENPAILEDEILLSNLILKSQISRTTKEELSGSELLKRLSEIYLETKLKTLYALAVDAEGNKVRVLIRNSTIVGVRIESKEGMIINGAEALKKLKEINKKAWRITTYLVPEKSA
ncbi:MAG: hypothetical protein QN229_04495 [Desulfurococcaceae archaeon TW002]